MNLLYRVNSEACKIIFKKKNQILWNYILFIAQFRIHSEIISNSFYINSSFSLCLTYIVDSKYSLEHLGNKYCPKTGFDFKNKKKTVF